MNRPQAVFFDLGKVLVDFDWTRAAKRIAPKCGIPALVLMTKALGSPLLNQYERGLISTDEFFLEFKRLSGYREGFETFAADFGDIFTGIPEMIGLQQRIHEAGIPTYVFSNTNELAVNHIRRHYSFFNHFDGYLLSYELKVMKPEPGIYEAAERLSGLSGSSVLYLDDIAANTAAGAARNWQVITHTSSAASIAAVERLLF
jgi:FMN phosphatase YigB (HAD superfamily)